MDKKGFTLTEIIIVLAIISALTAIAVPSYAKFKSSSIREVCIGNLRKLDDCLMLYNLELGVYPATVAEMVPDYLRKEPKCSQGTASYNVGSGNVSCPNVGAYPDHVLT